MVGTPGMGEGGGFGWVEDSGVLGSCGRGGDGLGTPAKLFHLLGSVVPSLPPTPLLSCFADTYINKAKCPVVSLPSPRVTPGLATTPSPGENAKQTVSRGDCASIRFWRLPVGLASQRGIIKGSGCVSSEPKDRWHNPG